MVGWGYNFPTWFWNHVPVSVNPIINNYYKNDKEERKEKKGMITMGCSGQHVQTIGPVIIIKIIIKAH